MELYSDIKKFVLRDDVCRKTKELDSTVLGYFHPEAFLLHLKDPPEFGKPFGGSLENLRKWATYIHEKTHYNHYLVCPFFLYTTMVSRLISLLTMVCIDLINKKSPNSPIPMPLFPAILQKNGFSENDEILENFALIAFIAREMLDSLYNSNENSVANWRLLFRQTERMLIYASQSIESMFASEKLPSNAAPLAIRGLLGIESEMLEAYRELSEEDVFSSKIEHLAPESDLDIVLLLESSARCAEALLLGSLFQDEFEAVFDEKLGDAYTKVIYRVHEGLGFTRTKLLLTTLALCEISFATPLHPALYKLRSSKFNYAEIYPSLRFKRALDIAQNISPPTNWEDDYHRYQKEICSVAGWTEPRIFGKYSQNWRVEQDDIYRMRVRDILLWRSLSPQPYTMFPCESDDKIAISFPPLPAMIFGGNRTTYEESDWHYYTGNWLFLHFGYKIGFCYDLVPPDLGPWTIPEEHVAGCIRTYLHVDLDKLVPFFE